MKCPQKVTGYSIKSRKLSRKLRFSDQIQNSSSHGHKDRTILYSKGNTISSQKHEITFVEKQLCRAVKHSGEKTM